MADEAKAAADKKLAEDKKKIAADNEARSKFYAERAKTQGKPTPTQEEADLAKLGNHVEFEPDGSPPDPNNFNPGAPKEAAHNPGSGSYAHRQSTARHSGASSGSSS